MGLPASEQARPRVGIVGAARARQGLGPFLARWFESAGASVVGVSGRDARRAQAAAAARAAQSGRQVQAYADAAALARAVDLLVVACPVDGHAAGLDAALAAGVPCLCEKPLVGWRDLAAGLARVAAFRARGLLLAENCQWPFALTALDALHPGARRAPVRSVAMRLSPASPGRAMVEDSLSHVLSLLQALVALPGDARACAVTQTDPDADAVENVVRFQVVGGAAPVDVELHLRCCPEQPRPAWYAVDGARLDREIGDGYAISFRSAAGALADVEDPLAALVYGVLADLKTNNRERIHALADAVALRLRLYAGVLGALTGDG
ncbi:MAG: Gfo/Idh/MocA family oxidoreductase [Planctomycetota bacterium]|nr:Gfo/Idh/MocA family oxidoreductase [Planctomycetota bacterium]